MEKKMLPKHDFTLFCDDVRQEIGNKLTLVGVFGDKILLASPPPAIMPKLSFFTRITGGAGNFVVTYSLIDPDGNELLAFKPEQKIASKPQSYGQLIIVVSPFRIEKEGEYTYKILIDGKPFHVFKFEVSSAEGGKQVV